MLPVQSGSNWWIDTTLLAGSRYTSNLRGSALSRANQFDAQDDSDGINSLISDVEEEGEVEETGHEFGGSIEETLEEEIAEGGDEMSASSETIAAMAMYLQIIEPIVRQRGSAGMNYNHKEERFDEGSDKESETSLLDDLLGNPKAALAATRANGSRSQILSLLA